MPVMDTCMLLFVCEEKWRKMKKSKENQSKEETNLHRIAKHCLLNNFFLCERLNTPYQLPFFLQYVFPQEQQHTHRCDTVGYNFIFTVWRQHEYEAGIWMFLSVLTSQFNYFSIPAPITADFLSFHIHSCRKLLFPWSWREDCTRTAKAKQQAGGLKKKVSVEVLPVQQTHLFPLQEVIISYLLAWSTFYK